MLIILALLQATAAPPPAATQGEAICPQMAERIPLKPPTATRKHWQFDTRGGIKGLFSGSVSTTFGARPVGEAEGKVWEHVQAMCQPTKKGGQCNLVGPLIFFVSFDAKQFAWELEPGDQFLFRVRGTILECEDLPAVQKADTNVR
jgi:hypothetical protein